tara:strand:- start:686 stop:931 length:246 start_codon:yes stop_codon:yes gene_type:complete
MKAIKIILNYLYLSIFIYPTMSYSCNIELKDLVVKSEVSEKFTNQKFLIKSGEKWFHISQDKECWISIREIKSKENKITLK